MHGTFRYLSLDYLTVVTVPQTVQRRSGETDAVISGVKPAERAEGRQL